MLPARALLTSCAAAQLPPDFSHSVAERARDPHDGAVHERCFSLPRYTNSGPRPLPPVTPCTMDWSLLDLSKDAEDVASGLQIFVDDVPGYDRDFLAHISALFAISAELRRLDELISRRANRRAAAKVTYELDLLCASMEMTLDTVKADLFGARAQANPRRAYEHLCSHFGREGRSFSGRLVAYQDLAVGLCDVVQGCD